MKKIVFILVFLPFASFSQGTWTVSFWYFQYPNDTLTINDSSWVSFKYSNNYGSGTPQDTMRLNIDHQNSDGTTNGTILEVFKMSFTDLDTITKQPDGTTRIYFKVPTFTLGKTILHHNYIGTDTPPIFYIRSNTPDVSFKSSDDLHVIPGQKFNFVISYTYKFLPSDTLRVTINGIEIGKESLMNIKAHHDTVSFIVPNYSSATYQFTFNYWGSNWDPLYISNTTTGILLPDKNSHFLIRYYNIQGQEIEKPTEGFYLWRSSNGASGKSFIN